MLFRRRLLVSSVLGLFLGNIQAYADSRPASGSGSDHHAADASVASGRVLVLGDSLSAEYGLPQGEGWVAQIEQRLHEHGTGYQIHNSSISGDTSSGGVNRLPAALERYSPDIVIIELGSNDALRGLSLEMTRKNLTQLIVLSQQAGAHVILVGMQIPPNYGKRYANEFADLFPALAKGYQTRLVPFLFEGFASDMAMFQDDMIHPNRKGQAIMADTVWKELAPLVTQATPD